MYIYVLNKVAYKLKESHRNLATKSDTAKHHDQSYKKHLTSLSGANVWPKAVLRAI